MLSKTPHEPVAATESAPKKASRSFLKSKKRLAIAGIILVLLAALAVKAMHRGPKLPTNTLRTKTGTELKIELATTEEQKQKGLSGRDKLEDKTGMLFVYDQPTKDVCIWMKDMKFAIDVVWLDQNKKIIDLRPNIKPNTYPQTFCARQGAQYFLEVTANKAHEYGLQRGSQVSF